MADELNAPSSSARPWAYMWRSNPDVTPADYTRQIEQLKDKGFGGFVGYLGSPTALAKDPRFPHILKEAQRCEMVVGMNNTAAWPAGGGWMSRMNLPWATVFSTLDVEGGRRFVGRLPEPPLPQDGGARMRHGSKPKV